MDRLLAQEPLSDQWWLELRASDDFLLPALACYIKDFSEMMHELLAKDTKLIGCNFEFGTEGVTQQVFDHLTFSDWQNRRRDWWWSARTQPLAPNSIRMDRSLECWRYQMGDPVSIEVDCVE